MAKPGFTLKGEKAMAAKLRALADQFEDKVSQALRVEAEQVMTTAKREYVPVDLNTLRSSGRVGDVERTGKDVQVSMSFGSAAAAYALAVHEHPSAASPPTWQGKAIEEIKSVRSGTPWSLAEGERGPKYLERSLNRAAKGMAARIAAKVEPR